MKRATEGPRVNVETIAEALGHETPDVDDVHARTRDEFEGELERR
jgi:hypothetical protein